MSHPPYRDLNRKVKRLPVLEMSCTLFAMPVTSQPITHSLPVKFLANEHSPRWSQNRSVLPGLGQLGLSPKLGSLPPAFPCSPRAPDSSRPLPAPSINWSASHMDSSFMGALL